MILGVVRVFPRLVVLGVVDEEDVAVVLSVTVLVVDCDVFYPNPPGPGGEGQCRRAERITTLDRISSSAE